MMWKSSDAETTARAMEGDEAAQRTLYEAHYAAAFRLAYLLLRDTRDAEEVVQDAFVYAFRNPRCYDPHRGSFWAWLRVILVSRCRNKRRRKRLPCVSLEALGWAVADPGPAGDPASVLERLGARQALWEALRQVTPGARDALILRYYEGLSYAEIAGALRCSNDAARARVAHGKKQLRQLLAAPEEGALRDGDVVCTVKVG